MITQEMINNKAEDIYILTTNKDEKGDHYKVCLHIAEIQLKVEALESRNQSPTIEGIIESDEEAFEKWKDTQTPFMRWDKKYPLYSEVQLQAAWLASRKR